MSDEVSKARTHRTPTTVLRGDSRRFVLLSAALVALTAAVGVFGYGLVPGRMAVRFTLDGDLAVVADQFLPRAVGLSVVPAVAAATLAGDRLLRRVRPAVSAADPYYGGAVLAVLTCLLVAQAGLVVVNAPTL